MPRLYLLVKPDGSGLLISLMPEGIRRVLRSEPEYTAYWIGQSHPEMVAGTVLAEVARVPPVVQETLDRMTGSKWSGYDV